MPKDKNKTPASAEQPDSNDPPVKASAKRRAVKLKPGRWKVPALICCVIIIGVILAAVHHKQTAQTPASRPADAVFNVNGRYYTQSEVKSLAAYPTTVGRQSYALAAKNIYNYLVYKAAAQAAGVNFSDTQLEQFRQQNGSTIYKQSNYEAYLNLIAYKADTVQYLQNAASYNTNGHYEGYSFVFHFDETLSWGPGYKSPHYGDTTLLARDKQYAQQKANAYHAQLAQHKITADKALAQIVANPRLGYYYTANNNYSAHFGTSLDSDWQRQVFFQPVITFIKQQKKPGLSAVQTGKVATVPDPKTSSDYADGYYYFVLLTAADPSFKTPQQAFEDQITTVTKHSQYYGVGHG